MGDLSHTGQPVQNWWNMKLLLIITASFSQNVDSSEVSIFLPLLRHATNWWLKWVGLPSDFPANWGRSKWLASFHLHLPRNARSPASSLIGFWLFAKLFFVVRRGTGHLISLWMAKVCFFGGHTVALGVLTDSSISWRTLYLYNLWYE